MCMAQACGRHVSFRSLWSQSHQACTEPHIVCNTSCGTPIEACRLTGQTAHQGCNTFYLACNTSYWTPLQACRLTAPTAHRSSLQKARQPRTASSKLQMDKMTRKVTRQRVTRQRVTRYIFVFLQASSTKRHSLRRFNVTEDQPLHSDYSHVSV